MNSDGTVLAEYHHPTSEGIACNCSERKRPLIVPERSNNRARQWIALYTVYAGECSLTAQFGSKPTSRTYSYICCRVCGSHWKTFSEKVIMAIESVHDLGIDWVTSHIPFVPEWTEE